MSKEVEFYFNPRKRKFNGEWYRNTYEGASKAETQYQAERFRSMGWKARVASVPQSSNSKVRRRWALYVRKR